MSQTVRISDEHYQTVVDRRNELKEAVGYAPTIKKIVENAIDEQVDNGDT